MLWGGASMAIASMWDSLASWFTPTVLFCVFNLMIATIFLASNFKSPNHHHNQNSPSQLTRSPSLLQRVKSVNLSSFYTTPESHDQYKVHSDQTTESNSVSQLSRAPSLLQRVKSIDYSFSSFFTPNNNSFTTESEQLGNSTSELTQAPSLLDRVKSFKLTSSFNSNHNTGDTNTMQDKHSNMDTHFDSLEDHNVTSGKLQYNKLANLSQNPDMTMAKRSPSNLSKSSSEKRVVATDDDDEEDVDRQRPATMRAPSGIRDESVDAKADDFIKRFKQQLNLQRVDSLQRFREMLNRGT